MNAIDKSPYAPHPYIDGKLKRMLIDGKWVEAVSGKTFDSLNPATGEVLAKVAEGDACGKPSCFAVMASPARA